MFEATDKHCDWALVRAADPRTRRAVKAFMIAFGLT